MGTLPELAPPCIQFLTDPAWFAPEVKNGNNSRLKAGFHVINSERKSVCKHPETTTVLRVDTVKQSQTFDVSQDGGEAILTDSGLLEIVKFSGRSQVLCCLRQDDHTSHGGGL